MTDVLMPRLSDSMEEGTILQWLVEDGAPVARGDELCEIETDKAAMTYEADTEGVVHHVAAEGDTLPIGAVIAQLLAEGEAPAASGAAAAAPAEATVASGATNAEPPAAEPATAAATVPAPAGGDVTAENGNGAVRVKASPLARRIAREHDLDLTALSGTGPNGRIVKADVEAAATNGSGPEPAAPATSDAAVTPATASPVAGAKGDVTVQTLTRGQKVVARRMAEAKATVPEFTLQATIDMEEAVALRAQLKAVATEDRPTPSYNDMIVKACALALREFPRANGSYRDAEYHLYSRVNVGIAVAADDGLVVPTIFDADTLSLGAVATEARRLAGRVRDGSVTPPELSGGTFTVSNLGMFGVTNFTAIINPPQAAILAVGTMAPRAVVRDGALVARQTMDVTLTSDHRILNGADAAQFLARIRALLETPLALVL